MSDTTASPIDLGATYAYVPPGDDEPTTVTIRMVRRGFSGHYAVRGLSPLFRDQLDAIDDLGEQLHTATVLDGSVLVLADDADPMYDNRCDVRRGGRVRTNYPGTPHLPLALFLDHGERLWDQMNQGRRTAS